MNEFISGGRLLSFSEKDPDCYRGTVIVCDFKKNKNKVRLERKCAESKVSTLINQPFVGKVVSTATGKNDFRSHEAHKVVEMDGNGGFNTSVVFDTSAFGTFTDASIQNIDGEDYIVADFVAWRRFKNACDVLKRRADEGTLSTSWEIAINDFEMDGDVKVVKDWTFLGHCALGESVLPAYDCSRVLDVAQAQDDAELASALNADLLYMASNQDGKEENTELENNQNVTVENAEEQVEIDVTISDDAAEQNVVDVTVSNEDAVENAESDGAEESSEVTVEDSALSVEGLYERVSRVANRSIPDFYGIRTLFPLENVAWCMGRGCDDNHVIVVQYSVDENDAVSIDSFAPAELVAAPIDLNNVAENLNNVVSELRKDVEACNDIIAGYKHTEDVDRITNIARASKVFTDADFEEGTELSEVLESADENKLNTMIVQRCIASSASEHNTATSAVNNIKSAYTDDHTDDKVANVRRFIKMW